MKNVMRWDPATGNGQIFADESDVPEGWINHHPDSAPTSDASAQPAEQLPAAPVTQRDRRTRRSLTPAKTKAPDMTRKEMVQALADGGITFNEADDDAALHALLAEKVKAVLTEQGIEFDPAAPTKTLLGLLSPAE